MRALMRCGLCYRQVGVELDPRTGKSRMLDIMDGDRPHICPMEPVVRLPRPRKRGRPPLERPLPIELRRAYRRAFPVVVGSRDESP